MIRESHRCRLVLGTALALVLTSSPLFAQSPATVTPGARVRVTIPDTVRQVPIGPRTQLIFGTVSANTADTLYLSVANTQGALAVAHTNVRALAISNGLQSRRRSILVNGLQWAVIGALEFYLLYDTRHHHFLGTGDQAALTGAGAGFAFGAFLGARRPVEQWRKVPLPSTARAP